ncbi:MAG: sulfatase-like hydrolase/transferase, partial [Planctomycetota bacterium]
MKQEPFPVSPATLGMRCGAVLALFEIGLALPVRLPALEEPLRRTLFFLLPLGVYLLLGAVAGALTGWVGRRIPRLRNLLLLLPGFAAAGVIALDVLRNLGPGGHLGRALLPGLAGGGLGLALAWLASPRRRRLEKTFRAAGGIAILLAAAGLLAWVGTERDPSRGVPAAPAADPSRPSVVLLTWDTVRADVLPIYGGRGLETPNLEKLAARSVVFENMFAVAPITGPTHASLLTGVVPPSHGLRSNGTTGIDPSVPDLAQSFRDAGYDTAAFVAGYPVKGKFGFRRGFRIYDDRLYRDRMEGLAEMGPMEYTFLRVVALWFKQNATAAIPGSMVMPRVARYLEEARPPFFLWVHLFDAHGPHDPEEPFRSRCLELAKDAWPPPADPENSGRQMTLYRGEIMELDSMLGQLLGMLKKGDPDLSRTAIYLTADHGHCFGEGGLINTHIPSLF